MPSNSVFVPADILLPICGDMSKWAAIACDQFSSEPEYWDRVKAYVGSEPSTLNMMLPECWLEGANMEETAQNINACMEKYLGDGTLTEVNNSYIFTRRRLSGGGGGGGVRMGIVGALDLDAYEYTPGSHAPVRASENTVIDRLPPRIYARERAELEMPHIIALIDDPDRTVIEPLEQETGQMECLYDFELMEGGGHIAGYKVTEELAGRVMEGLAKLSYPDTGKHGNETDSMLMIVGDGNHSLAAAKTCWEKIKPSLTEAERKNHPARFALVELNNIHDESLEIEPIHRAVFTADTKKLLEEFQAMADSPSSETSEAYKIGYSAQDTFGEIGIKASNIGEVIGLVESFIDGYTTRNGGRVDYIHGTEALKKLSAEQGVMGIFMPAIIKGDLFRSVAQGGVFPKKSFSMGHARDKRYYLELRRIK